jgi:hypothetical protein
MLFAVIFILTGSAQAEEKKPAQKGQDQLQTRPAEYVEWQYEAKHLDPDDLARLFERRYIAEAVVVKGAMVMSKTPPGLADRAHAFLADFDQELITARHDTSLPAYQIIERLKGIGETAKIKEYPLDYYLVSGALKISAPKEHALLISAPKETMPDIMDLINWLDEGRKLEKTTSIQAFGLEHISPSQAAEALQHMFGENIRTAVSEDKLVVRSTENHWEVIKNMLEQLDQPSSEGKSRELVTRFYKVQHVEVDQIGNALERILAESVGRHIDNAFVETYEQQNTVVMRAPEMAVLEIVRYLQLMEEHSRASKEQSPQQYQIRIAWLVGGLEKEEVGETLPKDLEPVAEELEKLGIQNLRLAAQPIIQVGAGKDFKLTIFTEMASSIWDMEIGGALSEGNEKESDRPILEIEIHGRKVSPNDREELNLSTSIKTQLEHNIVLGSTSSKDMKSVFVLQVQGK